jgi:transcriptional regulator with XRE-family HTH domain
LTLHEVACSAGVSVASWRRYETGERIPDMQGLQSLAAGVGITGQEHLAFTKALQQNDLPMPTLEGLIAEFSCGETALVSTYGALDSFVRLGKQLDSAERISALRAITRGILLTGDTESCLEAFDLMRPVLQPGDLDLKLKSMIALARINSVRRSIDARTIYHRYRSLVDEVIHSKTPHVELEAFLNLTRMAVAAGEREDADYLLSVSEAHFDAPDVRSNLVPYRKIVDALFGRFEEIVVESPPSCPIWNYTFLVTSLFSACRAKKVEQAKDLRERCRKIENRLGLGSPLVRQMEIAGMPI